MNCKLQICRTNWNTEPTVLTPAQCYHGASTAQPASPASSLQWQHKPASHPDSLWAFTATSQPQRKHKSLPISCAGFIKYVLWFEDKVCSDALSVFIPVFHSPYQLSPSDLWALRRLSHTNKAFICSQIYNQATKPPHPTYLESELRLLQKKGLHKGIPVIILSPPSPRCWCMIQVPVGNWKELSEMPSL